VTFVRQTWYIQLSRQRQNLWLALLGTLLVLLVDQRIPTRYNALRRIELPLVDARFSFRQQCIARGWAPKVRVDPSLLLVVVDDRSRAALSARPPQLWSREFCRVSGSMLKAGAKVVALDFLLEYWPPGDDPSTDPKDFEALAEAQQAASEARRGGFVGGLYYNEDQEGKLFARRSSEAFRAIVGEDQMALLNLTLDIDGRYRAQELVPTPRGAKTLDLDWSAYFAPTVAERATGLVLLDAPGAYVSLSKPAVLAAAERAAPPGLADSVAPQAAPEAAAVSAAGELAAPLPTEVPVISASDKRLWINAFDPKRSFPRLSFCAVLDAVQRNDQAWLRQHLAGRVVLIGLGSKEDQDLVPLALQLEHERNDVFSGASDSHVLGVEAHALVINTLLTRQWLRSPSLLVISCETLLLCLLVAVLVRRLSIALGIVALGGVMVGHLAGAFGLFVSQGLVVPVASPLVAVLLTAAGVWLPDLSHTYWLLRRYVSSQVAEVLHNEAAQSSLGAIGRREVTVLFSDINGFSTVCEKRTPEEVFSMLNTYLSRMVTVVEAHEGWVKQFVGDEIMAVYGAIRHHADPEKAAVLTALGMLDLLKQAHLADPEEQRGFYRVKIGIHSGEVLVGNVGGSTRSEYAVLGDDVNLGARIMSMASKMGVDLLISEDVYTKVADLPGVWFEDRGEQDVKGRHGRVRVYEVSRLHQDTKEEEKRT
jgi:class 3 adenylate cyclase/CHASE2 domain-containing sensor protein